MQVFEREITDILQGFANRLNSRLNRTPGVRVLKRLMERIRGKRKVILFTTNSKEPTIIITDSPSMNLGWDLVFGLWVVVAGCGLVRSTN